MSYRLPALLLLAMVLAVPGAWGEPSPDRVPGIGSIAPAFGLHSVLRSDKDVEREAIELDSFCGLRPGETKAVLLVFMDRDSLDGIPVMNSLYRKFHKEGLELIGLSVDSSPLEVRARLERSNLKYPVLDDSQQIVSTRYGLSGDRFTFLLNAECRVLGFSSRSLGDDQEALETAIEAQISGQLGSFRSGFE